MMAERHSEAIRAELGRQLADLYQASGITDAVPGSTLVDFATRGVSVESRSQGRRGIGHLDDARFLAITSGYAATLEQLLHERWAPANSERQRKADANAKRAKELRSRGLSAAQIAARMTLERAEPHRPDIDSRQVRRWLTRAIG